MGPRGAYLNFVLYIIPNPEHHNPKDSLGEEERAYKWKDQQKEREKKQIIENHWSDFCIFSTLHSGKSSTRKQNSAFSERQERSLGPKKGKHYFSSDPRTANVNNELAGKMCTQGNSKSKLYRDVAATEFTSIWWRNNLRKTHFQAESFFFFHLVSERSS